MISHKVSQGSKDSTLSKITLSTARIGSAKNIPETPAIAPPIIIPIIDTKAFISTLNLQS
jgi:hypothetical protein